MKSENDMKMSVLPEALNKECRGEEINGLNLTRVPQM